MHMSAPIIPSLYALGLRVAGGEMKKMGQQLTALVQTEQPRRLTDFCRFVCHQLEPHPHNVSLQTTVTCLMYASLTSKDAEHLLSLTPSPEMSTRCAATASGITPIDACENDT